MFSFLLPYVERDVGSAKCRDIYYAESFDSNEFIFKTLVRLINFTFSLPSLMQKYSYREYFFSHIDAFLVVFFVGN